MPILNIICWRPFWKLPWWQIKEFYWMYYIFCDDSRHRETPIVAFKTWNEWIFFTYTLIYMCNDDNDMKKNGILFSILTMWLYQAFICIDSWWQICNFSCLSIENARCCAYPPHYFCVIKRFSVITNNDTYAIGGWGVNRSGPPLLFRLLLGFAQFCWKVFYIYTGFPCMHIVTFTAHQHRKILRTPHFFGLATPLNSHEQNIQMPVIKIK